MYSSRFFSRRTVTKRIATILGATSAAALVSSSSVAHASAPAADARLPPRTTTTTNQKLTSARNQTIPLSRYAAADAVERILPSVVKIQVRAVRTENSIGMGMFSFDREPEIFRSMGSGFAIAAAGKIENGVEIVTNHHVIGEAVSNSNRSDIRVEINVTTADGITWPATVIAGDERSDVALLRVESNSFSIPPAELADSDDVPAGEFVVAVGAPLTLGNSCSFGIISSIRRDLSVSHGEDVTGQHYLQSDIALNSGSSGGPLCDLDGRVVGVCSKKVEGFAEGIGFAIPVNYAMKIVDHLRKYGKVLRPYLGVAVISLTKQVMDDIESDPNYEMPSWLQNEINKSNGTPFSRGLMVHKISKKGPADVGGLRKGDVILAVDGVLTTTASQFLREMSFKVGQAVQVQYRAFSDGSIRSTKLTPELLDS